MINLNTLTSLCGHKPVSLNYCSTITIYYYSFFSSVKWPQLVNQSITALCLLLCSCDPASFRPVCCSEGPGGCLSFRGLSAQAEVQHTVYWPLVYTSHSFQINMTGRETEAGSVQWKAKLHALVENKFMFILMMMIMIRCCDGKRQNTYSQIHTFSI